MCVYVTAYAPNALQGFCAEELVIRVGITSTELHCCTNEIFGGALDRCGSPSASAMYLAVMERFPSQRRTIPHDASWVNLFEQEHLRVKREESLNYRLSNRHNGNITIK